MGMGTDNMAEDMVEVMRAGLFLERVRRNDQMDPQPEEVLEWASRGGAQILGLGQETGSLEVGKKADLFMINMMRPHLVPTLRIVSGFVHNGQASDVQAVMVDGRWLMRDGKVLTIDEDDIVRRAEQVGHAAAGCRLTAQGSAHLHRLSGHDGRSVAVRLPVGVHHPGHGLGVGSHVWGRYIPVGTDQVLYVLGVAPGQSVQLA
jgi:adenine deaminase